MLKRTISVLMALCIILAAIPIVFTAGAETTTGKIVLTADMVTFSGTNYGSENNVVDGDQGTFWTGYSATSTVTLNMQTVYVVDHFVFKLPAGWASRTLTLTINGSTNGLAFTPVIEGEQTLAFTQQEGNTITLSLPAPVSVQYLQLAFLSNVGADDDRAQLSEWEVYGYADPDASLVGKIALATDMVTVSGSSSDSFTGDKAVDGDVGTFWNGNNATSTMTVDLHTAHTLDCLVFKLPAGWGDRTQTLYINGSTNGMTYTPILEGVQTLAFQSAQSNIVILPLPAQVTVRYLQLAFLSTTDVGQVCQIGELELYGYADPDAGLMGGKLSLTADMLTVSGENYGSKEHIVDGNQGSFWNGNGATATVTLNLGDVYMVDGFVVKLPVTNWQDRTQTLIINGSLDGETYTDIGNGIQELYFQQDSNNTVTVLLPKSAKVQYVQLAFQSNTGDPNAQLGEWEVYGYKAPEEPSKAITVNFVGRYKETVVTTVVTSAAELAELLTNTVGSTIPGYVFVGWEISTDDAAIKYDAAANGDTLDIAAVYQADTTATYAPTVTDTDITSIQVGGQTVDAVGACSFDTRITLTAAGEVAYWVLDGAKVGFNQNTYTFYVSGNNRIQVVLKENAETTIPSTVVLQQAHTSYNNATYTFSTVAQTSVKEGSVTAYGMIYAASVEALEMVKKGSAANVITLPSSQTIANKQYITHLLQVKPGKTRVAMAYAVIDGVTVYSEQYAIVTMSADGGTAIPTIAAFQ